MKLFTFFRDLHATRSSNPDNNRKEIDEALKEAYVSNRKIARQSIKKSQRAAKEFEQAAKSMYDVAEKIYIATGQNK